MSYRGRFRAAALIAGMLAYSVTCKAGEPTAIIEIEELIVSQINNNVMIYLPPIYLTNKHVGILLLVSYNRKYMMLNDDDAVTGSGLRTQ